MTTRSRTAHTIARTALLLAIAGAGVSLGGCTSWPPPRIEAINLGASQDFTLGRTALRGSGYKRLITTFAETHGLIDALEELEADVLAHEPVDDRVLQDIQALRLDTEAFRDEIRYKLDTRRREKWHRISMSKLWYRYRELNPDGMVLHNAYKRERRVDTDEIRDRRTPLTGEMRFSPWGMERWRRQPWEQNMYAPGGVPQIEKAPRWRGKWEYPDNGTVPQEHWGPDYRKPQHPRYEPAPSHDAPPAPSGGAREGSYLVPSSGASEAAPPPARVQPAPPPSSAPPARPRSASDVTVSDSTPASRPATTEPQNDEPDPIIDLIDP